MSRDQFVKQIKVGWLAWRLRRERVRRGRRPEAVRRRAQLTIEACGMLGVAYGIGMWILPLGIIAGSVGAILWSRLLDPPAPAVRDR